jgi:hypothetical protein
MDKEGVKLTLEQLKQLAQIARDTDSAGLTVQELIQLKQAAQITKK